MNLAHIGVTYRFERVTFVPFLTAYRTSTGLAQAFRFPFAIPITRRWFATVFAVLRQLIFQALHSAFEQANHAHQLLKRSNHWLFTSVIEFAYFVAAWQLELFHSLILSPFCLFFTCFLLFLCFN